MTEEELVDLYRSPDSVVSLKAFAGLDEIDWSAVKHAYGPAENVPALIRALASTEPTHRSIALQILFNTIWHQGTVYSATAVALPFLFRMLEEVGPHQRSDFAVLISAIADGQPPFAQCENNPEEAERWRSILAKSDRDLDAEMEEGKKFGAEIRQIIISRIDVLHPFVCDPNQEVRRNIVIAIGCFPEFAKRVTPDLTSMLAEEPEEFVRQSIQETIAIGKHLN